MSTRPTDPAALLDAAQGGDRVALARLLSYVERGGEQSRQVAHLAYQSPGRAYTVGLTGAPGSGKSTLTDRLIGAVREKGFPTADAADAAADADADTAADAGAGTADAGAAADGGARAASADNAHQVAVLAIDPSSPFTGGAILGDRVRMQDHALDDGVYIRSMATRGHLGGLAVAVPDAVRLLSAVGLPVVLVETVGVGQVEVDVASATDTTVVVVNPGWGDAIQANKAGLLEIADLFVINKADRPGVRETRRDLEGMLDLTALGEWRPPIVETVASTGEGMDDLWTAIADHRSYLDSSGLLDQLRRERLEREFHQILVARLERKIVELHGSSGYAEVIESLTAGELDPYRAADQLLAGIIVPDPPSDEDQGT
ncbi:MAG TPA: methylmalonyl Co-A mutase-associated GTPase MeaB [Acidimicrobiales bacterium]|jgi:LAO/AO transport system kinase|nr:methylmalonyl Co-A mutase-associated GTPase MeaB [Acidimicrobiales bacterium]